jgi:DNA-damage-inducible protein J
MMATIQVRIDDQLKTAADSLFSRLGLDTTTAIRIFLAASLDNGGIPFKVKHYYHRKPNAEMRKAMEDIRLNRNLYGPFTTVEDAMRSMLED